jgi:hypothetical protein
VAQIWSTVGTILKSLKKFVLDVDCGTLAAAVFIERSPVEWAFPENQSGSKRAALYTETHKPASEIIHFQRYSPPTPATLCLVFLRTY